MLTRKFILCEFALLVKFFVFVPSFFNVFNDINPCLRIKMLYFCQIDTLLDSVKWDGKGLAVAIAQNVDTGAILMQGFANREAVVTTISSRKATFYSRSRSTLWTKGETSNNFINIHDVFLDCDHDSVSFCPFSH